MQQNEHHLKPFPHLFKLQTNMFLRSGGGLFCLLLCVYWPGGCLASPRLWRPGQEGGGSVGGGVSCDVGWSRDKGRPCGAVGQSVGLPLTSAGHKVLEGLETGLLGGGCGLWVRLKVWKEFELSSLYYPFTGCLGLVGPDLEGCGALGHSQVWCPIPKSKFVKLMQITVHL